MPYKRRARLLVLGRDDRDPRPRWVVERAAQPAFGSWIEARAAPARAGDDPEWAEATRWADLLVTVDEAAALRAERWPRASTCRLKRWRLPVPAVTGNARDASQDRRAEDAPVDREVVGAIDAALACMVGGMRMLSRLDAADGGGRPPEG